MTRTVTVIAASIRRRTAALADCAVLRLVRWRARGDVNGPFADSVLEVLGTIGRQQLQHEKTVNDEFRARREIHAVRKGA